MRNTPLPVAPDKSLNALQGLVVDLIHRLLSATLDHVDDAINEALARLGRFGGRDRAMSLPSATGSASTPMNGARRG